MAQTISVPGIHGTVVTRDSANLYGQQEKEQSIVKFRSSRPAARLGLTLLAVPEFDGRLGAGRDPFVFFDNAQREIRRIRNLQDLP